MVILEHLDDNIYLCVSRNPASIKPQKINVKKMI